MDEKKTPERSWNRKPPRWQRAIEWSAPVWGTALFFVALLFLIALVTAVKGH